MTDSRVIWTALPLGLDAQGHLRLTALASIRLRGTGALTLQNFDWIRNWTTLVDQASWHASFGQLSAELEREGQPQAAGKDWWDQLFPASTPVNSHAFDDLSAATIVSYDPSKLQEVFLELYGTAAAAVSSQDLPSLAELGAAVSSDPNRQRLRDLWPDAHKPKPEKPGPDHSKDRDRLPAGYPYDGPVARPASAPTQPVIPPLVPFAGITNYLANGKAQAAIGALDAYMAALRPDPDMLEKDKPKPNQALGLLNAADGYQKKLDALKAEFDFHAKLSTLGQHAPLMRMLRLTVPLRSKAPITAKVTEAQKAGVRVICDWNGGPYSADALPDGAPLTALGTGLKAASRPDGYLTNGWLDPVKAGLSAIQMDVEGATRKLQGLDAADAGTAKSEVEALSELTALPDELASDQDAGLPALRSQGFALTFAALDDRLRKTFDRAKALNDDLDGAPLAKKDLTEGPDIPGLVVAGGHALYAEDLTRGFRIDVLDQDAPNATWRSLHRRTENYAAGSLKYTVVESEGLVRGALAQAGVGDDVSPVMVANPALAVWTGWSLSVPHPAKVVGNEIGAGTADAPKPELLDPSNPESGLGLAVSHTDAKGLPSLRYGRHYGFRVRAVDLAGQSLPPETVAATAPAIKAQRFDRLDPIEPPVMAFVESPSDHPIAGEALHRLAIRSLAGDADGSSRTSRRLAYPPRVAMDQAERHGKLDKDGRIDPAAYAVLAQKDHPLAAIPTGNVPLETTDGVVDADVEAPEQRIAPPGQLEPGYLPDPLSGKWVVKIEPIRASGLSKATPETVVLAGDWPNFKGLIVTLDAGPAGAVLSQNSLAVTLPPGEAVRISLSAVPPQPKAFGVWNWANQPAFGPLGAPVIAAAETGQHWMLSPVRTLEVVHAVQKPVLAPTFGAPVAPGGTPAPWPVTTSRGAGAKAAGLSFASRVHLNSTRQIEVYADWKEPVDAIGPTGPTATPHAAQSLVRPVTDADFLNAAGDAPAAWIAGQPVSTRDLAISDVQTFADARARLLSLKVAAVSRYREYMPKAVREDHTAGLKSPTALTDDAVAHAWIPSAARPPAPIIVSVTPTFAWERDATPGAAKQSSHRGRPGYRVWLDRPWSITGFNEMLAVCSYVDITDKDIFGTRLAEEDRKGLVTQWGLDPLFIAKVPTNVNQVQFPRAVGSSKAAPARPAFFATPEGQPWAEAFDGLPDGFLRNLVSLPGRPGRRVFVSPHLVDWDPERKLWFCDIEIETDEVYMPFVQLALARYQPMSLYAQPEHALMAGIKSVDRIGVAPHADLPAEDLHLSPPVATDFLQILPERLTRIEQADGYVDVRVFGVPAPSSTFLRGANFQIRLVDLSGPDPDLHPAGKPIQTGPIPAVGLTPVALGSPSLSAATAAGLSGVIGTAHPIGAPGATVTTKKPLPLLFSARVPLPKGGFARRLVIEELEDWPTPIFDQAQQFPPGVERGDGRLVYLDQFDL